ncbi:hypothetical protein ABZ540_05060 [Nocardia xishanensis]|uniref:hypothetical protein n=1 Tax=Nocardia xishanensis TaxID=238964 RepID=UPI0033F42A79
MNGDTPRTLTPTANEDVVRTARFAVLSPGQCAALQALSALIALAEASAVTWSVAAIAVVVLALGRWRRPRNSDRGAGASDRPSVGHSPSR